MDGVPAACLIGQVRTGPANQPVGLMLMTAEQALALPGLVLCMYNDLYCGRRAPLTPQRNAQSNVPNPSCRIK